ncbi:uncharacterized protein PITG_04328 [Phytophthora infestans T30-4]|uniref:DDE Tnp4 domain-containing protein n=1 Tax=Phytophthora infestans (strain T30-4) TaxID=403677 RepID=D0N109_PHYIT|nr:uncharacterized protein PITG_04328 [Phytophthora infestans T30-4]EEY67322.1 conserved hypothetical protein [Phytophthora infestans T30-4]|eukprot:XP_002905970.1 conserved hypothetical protein [Phytophthora infestans T30-4]
MNATEFHDHFRLDRDVFFRLVALVKHHSAFIGTYGNDNTAVKLGLFLGIASGSVHIYLFRATNVVLKLEPVTMAWPNEEERVMISLRMQQKYGFVNCVGITDGTLFPLAAKPQHQGEGYSSRKASYSVHGLVTCDDVGSVRSLVVGWPGSTHDNRAWMNSPLILKRADHFKHNEYVLGDSAFQASSVMIPAFKNPPKAQMNPRHTYFNKQLAKARIKSEHCIRLLKMRFPYLREIRVKLGKKRKHIRRLIRHVTCASILHNLLIAEPIPHQWQNEIERQITSRLDDDDELNEPIPEGENGDKRRNQLLAYMLEVRDERQQEINFVF